MINVEGYKAFRGVLRISPKNGMKPFEIEGDFVYKPMSNCWYGNGHSYSSEICEVVRDDT